MKFTLPSGISPRPVRNAKPGTRNPERGTKKIGGEFDLLLSRLSAEGNYFFAAGFFAGAFFATFLAGAFFAVAFLAGAFFAGISYPPFSFRSCGG